MQRKVSSVVRRGLNLLVVVSMLLSCSPSPGVAAASPESVLRSALAGANRFSGPIAILPPGQITPTETLTPAPIPEITLSPAPLEVAITEDAAAGSPATIVLKGDRAEMYADGQSRAAILVQVFDAQGQAVADGTAITLSTDRGTLTSEHTTTRDGMVLRLRSGQAWATLTAGLDPGAATITAQAGEVKGQTVVTLVSPPADTRRVVISRAADPAGAAQAEAARHQWRGESDGTALVEDAAYRARFADGLEFALKGGEKGERARLGISLEQVRLGATVLYEAGQGERRPPAARGNRVHYPRGEMVIEEYAALDAVVEQSFIITRLPAGASQDLVIELALQTGLKPIYLSDEEGVIFLDGEGQEVLAYGGATVRDAAGRETMARLALEGTRLSLTVPGEWLGMANYPLLVDPLIGDPILVCGAGNWQSLPSVAYNGDSDEFLVVWKDKRNDGYGDVYGQLIRPTGELIGTNFAIAGGTGIQSYPAVAYNAAAGEYLVAWMDSRVSGEWHLYGQRVAADGTLVGSEIAICTERVYQTYPSVIYQPASGEWLVVWNSYREDGTGVRVWGQRVSAGGELVGTNFIISQTGLKDRPDVAANPAAGEYLAVWYRHEGDEEYRIHARRVLSDGTGLGDELLLSPPANEARWPRVIYNANDDEYLVVWQDYRNGNWDIFGQRVSAGGELLGNNFAISSLAGSETLPSLAWDGNGGRYLVGWQGWGLGQRVWADGTLDGGPIDPAAEINSPDYAYGEISGLFLGGGEIYGDIYAQRYAIPVARFSAEPLSGSAPLTVTFSNQSLPTVGVDGFEWDFGDGATSTEESPTHVYTATGVYTVALTVSSGGESDTETKAGYITVTGGGPAAPVADFSAEPLSGTVPLTVTFSNQSGGEITAYEWAFGDGMTDTITHPVHVYTTTGVYTVSLTASGPGGSDTLTRTNYITAAAPSGGPELTLGKTAPTMAFPGDAITYTVWLTNRGSGPVSGAVVTDTLPLEVALITTTIEGASYLSETHQVVWQPGPIAGGQTVSLTLPAEMRWEVQAGQAVVNEATLTRVGSESQTITATTLITASQVTQGEITPAGGSLTTADGRIAVDFPAGAVTETVTVQITSYTEEPRLNGDLGMFLRFDLEVLGREGIEFTPTVTLTLDVTGLIEWPLLDGRELRLDYLHPDGTRDPMVYEVIEGESLLLQADLEHFSMVGAWIKPQDMVSGWSLLFNDAQVSLFSGAATYNYPIDVPPGRRGVQPTLNLSYNSKRVDGIRTWIQGDWVGLGWSIDTVEIVRHVEKRGHVMGYENKFTLLINGSGYRLVKVDGPPQGGRYRIESGGEEVASLRIERHNDKTVGGGSPQNLTGEYWTIHLPDGTFYRLGYRTDSEQVVDDMWYYQDHWRSNKYYFTEKQETAEYAGKTEGSVTFRWRLDQVVDVYGNEMELWYDEEPRVVTGYNYGDTWSRASYLREIRYARRSDGEWGYRVVFNRRGRSGGDNIPDCTARFYQADYLHSIQVWQGNEQSGEIIREYLFDYEISDNPGTLKHRLLKSITPYGRGGVVGGQRLPTTTFTYTPMPNKRRCVLCSSVWDQEGFDYERLTRVDNGYGGVIEMDYQDDDRSGYWRFLSYRVSMKRVSDGRSPNWVRADYTYGPACYNQWSSEGLPEGATLCPESGGDAPGTGPLVGHQWAEMTTYDYDEDTVLAVITQTFHVPADGSSIWRLGRPRRLEQRDGQENLFSYTENDWVETEITPGVHFVYLAEQRTGTCDGDATCRQTRTTYAYDPASQGGTQYGNLTDVYEYGEGTTVYRHTHRDYLVTDTTSTYIVNRVAAETLYDEAGNVVAATRYLYDGQGYGVPPTRGDVTEVRRLSQASPETWLTVSTIEYDGTYGYPYAVTDANGKRTVTAYDNTYHLYPIRVTNALSQTTIYEYDYTLGVVIQITDPNGAVTSGQYDAFGRLTHLWRPGDFQYAGHAATQVFEYNDVNPTGVVNLRVHTRTRDDAGGAGPAGYLESYTFYDGLGRTIQTQSETGGAPILVSQRYDAQGQVERTSVPYYGTTLGSYQDPNWGTLAATIYAYDALGRTTVVTNPDSTTVTTAYDDWTTISVDANGHRREHENDAFGRLIAVREYTGTVGGPVLYATTQYTYDERDNLIGVEDALGHTTVITYNLLGRKVAMDDPDMGLWSYTYDANGNLESQTDAAGRTIQFEYDALNRLTDKLYPPGSGMADVHYSYDEGPNGIGRRTGMTDGSGSTAYTYDARGRKVREVKAITDAAVYTTTYTYDDADRVATMTYPDGEVITYTYDAQGLPQAMSSSLGEDFVQNATYNQAGQLTALYLGNGRITSYDYNPLNFRLESLVTDGGLQNLAYTYDAVGNVLSIQDAILGQTQHFQYDPLDRLVRAYTTGSGEGSYDRSYAYDQIGNMTRKGDLTLAYEDAAHVHAVTSAGENSYTYDANGNMVLRVENGMTYTQEFDLENRLVKVISGTEETGFVYDGDGVRVKRINPDGTINVYLGDYYEELLPAPVGGSAWAGAFVQALPEEEAGEVNAAIAGVLSTTDGSTARPPGLALSLSIAKPPDTDFGRESAQGGEGTVELTGSHFKAKFDANGLRFALTDKGREEEGKHLTFQLQEVRVGQQVWADMASLRKPPTKESDRRVNYRHSADIHAVYVSRDSG
ncbi:MAG: PKD domain-containing protein, partial [Anaerolineae bacterium]|nr:PKD domain-containing protein [Anaerolineae bacterium]